MHRFIGFISKTQKLCHNCSLSDGDSILENPTGTVTFLFSDIQGSTQLARDNPEIWEVLRARHNAILRAAFNLSRGYILRESGDSFCAAFHSPAQAVRAAVKAQLDLHSEDWGKAAIRVRMGIHTGQAELQPSGDYHGYLTLSQVQRLMSAAHGGQVLVSRAAQELLRDDLADDVTLRDLGELRLRDMLRPENIYELVIPGVPADFPPINALDVPQHNLPAQMTSFIGRQAEIADIRAALRAQRLVTLTGSGGAGKTRLGLEVAAASMNGFPGGVWLIELAPVADPALIPHTLLSALKLREERHRTTLETLIDYLRPKTLLLVLDNCEHLIDACAQICETLLFACPNLRILATSGESLGIAGELPYRIPSLDVPDPAQLPALYELEKVDSIRLFVERAGTAKPGFVLTEDNASFVARICSRLDGIPLAIELAASRVKVLAPGEIARRLDDRFRLLTGGSRTSLPRHQTLRAMMDWSYALLSEDEKALFRRLAVFAGGWTLEAAEAVCEGSGSPVLDLLTRLVDKSLVILDESTGEVRYRRLETIRQYSRERLLETSEVQAIKDRHLEFFASFAELVDDNLKRGEQLLWQKRMLAELDNLRAALEWSLSQNPDRALQIAGAANLFWTAGGYSAEGFLWTQRALEEVEKAPLPAGMSPDQRLLMRARALRGITRLYLSLGDNISARRAAEESVALYRQSSDPRGLAFALVVLAYPLEFLGELTLAESALQESNLIAHAEGDVYVICRSLNLLARVVLELHHDPELARGYVEESLRLASKARLRSQEAQASEILGTIAIHRADYNEARARFKEAMMVYQEIDAKFNVLLEKSNLAHLERLFGNHAQALQYYSETITAFRDIGQAGAVSHQLECVGFIACAGGENRRAVQLFAAANRIREDAGTPMTPDEQTYFDGQLHILRNAIDQTQFALLWSQGQALSMDQAIDLARESP